MNNQNVCSLCYFFKQTVLMYKDTVVHSWVFTIACKNWKLPAFQYNVTSISIQRYQHFNTTLPAFQYNVTSISIQRYQHFNTTLPAFQYNVTSISIQRYQHFNTTLPAFQYNVTSISIQRYQHFNTTLPAFQYNVTSISIQRYKSSNIPPANCCYRFQQWFLLQTWLWTWKDNAWGKNQNNKLHVCTF